VPTAPRDPQLLKGVLPILVLTLLTEHESYGYELVTRLQTDGLADMTTGTVYPVLTRLVASSAGPARKYYVPTPTGASQLDDAVAAWRELVTTVDAVLARALPATPSRTEESA
jgi:PadR family transcriptional regulator PadR